MIASMAQSVLLAVDRDSQVLAALERDLTRRFKADYRIVTENPACSATRAVSPRVAAIFAGSAGVE